MYIWFILGSLLLTQSGGFTPVANVTEIMQSLVIPSSNELFNVGLEAPDSDEAWKNVETNAIILAESGNLLKLPSRAQERAGWMEAAGAMTDAGQRALDAARSRDADEDLWFELSDQILEACSSCHDQYWIVN